MPQYRIYGNDGADGPIDYATPLATVTGLSWATPPLGAGAGDTTTGSLGTHESGPGQLCPGQGPAAPGGGSGGIFRYGVRAYDPILGLEERNTDAAVRIEIDADGVDVTDRPGPVTAVQARPLAGGAIEARWTYLRTPGRPEPTGFRIWATAGGSVDYAAAPAATVAYGGSRAYVHRLAGPFAGNRAVGVRAYNGVSHDGNTLAATVTPDSSAPDAPDDLTAELI